MTSKAKRRKVKYSKKEIEDLMTILTAVLGVVIAIDHYLASNSTVAANSTGQLVLNLVDKMVQAVIDVIGK